MSSNKRAMTPNSSINYGATDMIDTNKAKQLNQASLITPSEAPKPAVRLKIKKMSDKSNQETPAEYHNDAFEKDQTSVINPVQSSDDRTTRSKNATNFDNDKSELQVEESATKSTDKPKVQLEMGDTSCKMECVGQTHQAGHESMSKSSALPMPISEPLQQPIRPYPKKVLFIVANEFCERFSYYGLRTVLVLYLKDVLGFSNKNATVSFHLFATLCYIMPIFGAILGDSIWGKYKTILYLSMVYCLGEAILVISSIFWDLGALSVAQALVGLFLIGFGTGGIKPCVLSFGGDQFLPHEAQWRQNFFSIFYASINLGSLISMFFTPLLRSNFQCVDRSDCFPYAFGLPCLLMFVSVIIFLLARNQYFKAPLPERNVITAFLHCTFLALSKKFSGFKPRNDKSSENLPIKQPSSSSNTSSSSLFVDSDEGITIPEVSYDSISIQKKNIEVRENPIDNRSHWLHLASDSYDSKSIEEFKSVLSILLLFSPLPVYWCLSDQQGSIWTLQAVRMDGNVFNTGYYLQPDQMSVANPLLLLLLIPVYEVIIYPIARKCNLLTTSIQRMTVGGLLASLAFVTSAMIEYRMEEFMPKQTLDPGQMNLLIVNGLRDCSIANLTMISLEQTNFTLNNQSLGEKIDLLLPLSTQSLRLMMHDPSLQVSNETFTNYKLKFSLSSIEKHHNTVLPTSGCPFSLSANYELTVQLPVKESAKLLYIEQGNGKLDYKLFDDSLTLPPAGQARVRLLYEFFGSYSQAQKKKFSMTRQASSGGTKLSFQPFERLGQVILSDYITLNVASQGELFSLKINVDQPMSGTSNNKNLTYVQNELFIKPGTRNLILVHQNDATNFESELELLQDNNYRISMLYQLIPYLVISLSEVMFSVTGLEFSYSMAPETMKSVILAAWLLTVAFGNLLTVLIEAIHLFSNPAHDLLFYAAFMAVDMLLFAILGYRYEPKQMST